MSDELEDQMVAKTEELAEEKKGDEAVVEATELAAIDPKEAIAWFMKGKAHYVDAQYEEALSCFSKAAQMEKENPRIWHLMGYTLITLGRLEEAEQALEYVRATDPSNAEAACALAICQVMQKKPKEARQNVDLAITLNKQVAFSMLEHFHEKYFAVSPDTAAGTKAILERMIETMKLTR